MKAVLRPDLRAVMLALARDAYPNECCGLLEGMRDGETFQVTALHPARNLSDDAQRFQIDPADHIAASKAARTNGRSIIGCYHSHPNGRAQPSATDLAGAGEDNFLWLIAADGIITAFVYRDGGFRGCVTGAD